jgi:hypothetical protein
MQLSTNTGVTLLNGVSNEIVFGVIQPNVIFQQGNTNWSVFGTQFANYANCAAVFQEFRITHFAIEVYFSVDNVLANTAYALPMVYALVDRENDRSVTGVTTALQYPSCRIIQAGAPGNPNGHHTITVKSPSCYLGAVNSATLGGTVVQGPVSNSPWLPCGSNSATGTAPNIPQGFIKMAFDAVNVSTNANVGYFTFIADVIIQYRGID